MSPPDALRRAADLLESAHTAKHLPTAEREQMLREAGELARAIVAEIDRALGFADPIDTAVRSVRERVRPRST